MVILKKVLSGRSSFLFSGDKSWDKKALSFLEDIMMLPGAGGGSSFWIVFLHGRNFKYIILTISMGACLFLEWYLHYLKNVTIVYTHLFYIPIIISSVYYGFKGGLYSSLFLALVHNRLFFGGLVPELAERGLLLVIVGASSGYAVQLLNYFMKSASRTQEMYKDLVENISMPSVILEIGSGMVMFANRAFTDLATEDRLGGEIQWESMVVSEDMHLVEEIRREFGTSLINYKNVECRILDRSGYLHNMVCEIRKLPFFHAAILYFKDITENKRLKSESMRATAMFEELYENAPSALLLVSPEGNIVRHNKRFRVLFGIPENMNLEGMEFSSVIDGENILQTFCGASGTQNVKRSVAKEFTGKTRNGETLSLLGTLVPFDFEEHQCFFIALEDLSELKKLMTENKQRMEMFMGLFENSPAALVLVDSDLRVLDANKEFQEVFQIADKNGVLGKILTDIVLTDEDTNLKTQCTGLYSQCVADGYARGESLCRRTDGRFIPVDVRSVRVPHGDDYAFLVHYINLSEQKDREEKLQNAYYHLSHTIENLIFTISNIIESRDPYTSGHQKRVAELSRNIAEELGLNEEEVKGIYFAGLLHDIGKIKIPAEILSKPGKLTSVEMDLVRIHPETGADILKSIPFQWPVKDMVRHHHERLDGSGYPDELKGETIYIGTRILAVADVVEAMMSHRPYRPALGMGAAIDEIKSGSGTLYDPEVVGVCKYLLEEKNFSFG